MYERAVALGVCVGVSCDEICLLRWWDSRLLSSCQLISRILNLVGSPIKMG